MLYFSTWKTVAVLALCALGILFALPNVLPQSVRDKYPSWFPARTVVLGLDLQGGSQLLLEVDGEALRRSRQIALQEDVRRVLREARIGTTAIQLNGNTVSATLRDPGQKVLALEKLRTLATPVGTTLFGGSGPVEVDISSPSDRVVAATLTEAALQARIRSAVDQSLQIVDRRVNELGTVEPSIQREGADRILLQVPGLQDPQRLKDLLGQTAKLEFRLVDLSMPAEQAAAGRPPADVPGPGPPARRARLLRQRRQGPRPVRRHRPGGPPEGPDASRHRVTTGHGPAPRGDHRSPRAAGDVACSHGRGGARGDR